jgi:hypothetical protein
MSGVEGELKIIWYGWPGVEIPMDEKSQITEILEQEYNAVLVLLG